MSRARAYNAPPPGYVPPSWRYVVVMRLPDGSESASDPLHSNDVDRFIGYHHRGGWTYLRTEQVAA